MSGKKKNKKASASSKLPVGADGLNKHQRYYQKRKRLAQIKKESTPSTPDKMETLEQLNDRDSESSQDSFTHPPRLFYHEREENEADPKTPAEMVSTDSHAFNIGQFQDHSVQDPATSENLPASRLQTSHDSFGPDWHTSSQIPDSITNLFSTADAESPTSHDLLNFSWRPPKQISVSTEDPNFPHDYLRNDFGDYGHFMQTRDLVARWSNYWTGMENWPEALDRAFERHKVYGPDGPALFLRKVWYHEQRGRQLLHCLQSQRSADSLPSNPEALMALWNLQQDQVMVLTRGLTIMELTGSLALRYPHSIGRGEVIGVIPSALSAPDTPLFRPSRDPQTKQDEQDIENYLTGSD